jgi:hypothetical protein
VPLSEREQRILEEIEQTLYKEDPAFARETKKIVPHAAERRKAQAGGALFFIGFSILIGFFITGSVIVGVTAFGAMVAGIVLIAGSVHTFLASKGAVPGGPSDRLSSAARSWEEKLRDRYRKR